MGIKQSNVSNLNEDTAALSVYLQLSFLNVKYQAVVGMIMFPRALEGSSPPEAFSMPAATRESCPGLGALVETK